MQGVLVPMEEIRFLLFDWLRIDRDPAVDGETIGAVLDLATRLAAEEFLPHYRAADIHEPRLEDGRVKILPAFVDILRRYADLGLCRLSFPESHGGLGLPQSVHMACLSIFASANIAASGYTMLTAANARLLLEFGSESQIEAFARPQIDGRWFGTMCLSEPQAGSGLADIRCRATREGEDGLGQRYRLRGNKMWISGGDQNVTDNIVHLVLAKVPQADGALPAGTTGISLFIVPRVLPDGAVNDVAVAGLNHKMGYRGTANCLLNFGEGEGAVGWLVGREGDGLRQMFTMMNEARVSVGTGAAALAMRSHRAASAYAKERRQGRRPGQTSDESVPIVEHPDVRRMLLQQKAYAEGALALCLYCAALGDRDDEESGALLDLLTPVAKSWPAEFGLVANDIAIQVHGGYGYTRDFDVEQLWRDNRLNPIHEGATGIQGIDLFERKILKAGPLGIAILGRRIEAAAQRTTDAERAALLSAWAAITDCIADMRRRPVEARLADSTPFLRAFGHVVVAWIWLELATAARDRSDDFGRGKALASRYFCEVELPFVSAWLAGINQNGAVLQADVAIF